MNATIKNLRPHTWYRLAVTSKPLEGGFESDSQNVTYITDSESKYILKYYTYYVL